jgi:predicted nucleic acid-binding protein
MPVSFIDTNVLIYLASSDTIKADRAEQTVAAGGIISVQVLNELASVARRKLRLPWQQTREFLSAIRSLLEVRPVTADVQQAGLAVAERYGLSIYDAMIVAAALDAGCTTLWSVDMQDGLLIESQLRVANPF